MRRRPALVVRPRLVAALAVALSALLAIPPLAQATFHEMSIREVYPGGENDASYVELQMWAAFQNFVGGHRLVAYDAAGKPIDDVALAADVKNGANQSTILVADTSYSTVFDEMPAPDDSDEGLDLSPEGGAVCWIEGSPPDCVAWGDFKGPLPAHVPELKVGSPASPGGVKAGKALRRSIAKGCATLLDPPPTDDSDDSSTDFSEVDPAPRDNATKPTEAACPSLPNTTIDTKPANPTKATSASFTYHATPSAGATFECSLAAEGEADAFESCPSSGKSYSGLADGGHTFKVRAVNSAGADPTPAAYTWTLDTVAPEAEVQTHPPDPSPGNSATFTYGSTEGGSGFECSLEPEGTPASFSDCPTSGKTYPDAEHPAPLADGEWTFAVRATDKAGNQGAAVEFTWTVESSAPDETPPETTLLARPPNPSNSPTASFTYESNEPGSSFECKLDGGAFAGCSPTGVAYAGLGDGPHSFQVRAIDSSDNVDPTPAGYSFDVVLAGAPFVTASAPSPAPTQVVPETTILAGPKARTRDRTPTFRFRSDQASATFQCKLDRKPFKGCRSPLTTARLAYGSHSLRVRAALAGAVDSSPARLDFTVVRHRR
ncbi:MAG TPA: hypothetical protein VF245_09160 [Solirubrobacterales bacterium]